MLEHALKLAYEAHEGQVDKAGAPYILHCLRVANAVETKEQKTVALLHDVMKDTDITADMLIAAGFSNVVVDAVDAITRLSSESYRTYLKRVATNDIAYKVKLADMWDNSDVTRLGATPTEEQVKKCAAYISKRNQLFTLRSKVAQSTLC